MKKTSLLFVMLMVVFMSAKAQFSENFNSVTAGSMPAGWTVFNVDGLTPNSAVNWVTNAWVCKTYGNIPTSAAWSTSWYTSAGQSDDWMFTPAIVVPTAATPVLKYTVLAQDPDYADGYELRIMTTAPTAGNITTSTVLLTAAAAETTPTVKIINLTSYAGQTVYIGWRNNSYDKFMLGVDDVEVKSLPNDDAAIVSINTPTIAMAGNINITGTVKNEGFNAITSFSVTYTIDGGAASAAYNVSGQNIAAGGTYNFTHNVPAALTAGSHTIEVTISNVNGSSDPNPADNVVSKTIGIASSMGDKVALIEGFSSSTCAPCATWNATFNPWATTNDNKVNYIKYQVNWPYEGDPYYIAAAGDRVDYYNVGGVPDMYHDGAPLTLSTAGLNSAITEATSKQSPFGIECNVSVAGNVITVPVTINPHVTISGLKVHCVIIEKKTTGNVAPTSPNGETEWHHVMMAMVPSSAGTTVNFTDGTAYTNTFTKDMTGTFVEEMSDLTAIIFIQDDETKEIFQSKTYGSTDDINENSFGNLLIYPNPSSEIVNIINAENSTIQVYDLFGKLVMSDNNIDNNYLLNVSSLSKGTYIIKIINDGNICTRKITVLK